MTGATTERWARVALVVWTVLGVLVSLILLGRMLAPLRPLVVVAFLALIIVVLLAPAVDRLERRRVPRPLGTALSFLSALVVVALTVRLVLPVLVQQFRDIAESLPELWAGLEPRLSQVLGQVGVQVQFDPEDLSSVLEDQQVHELLMRSLGGISGFAGSLLAWVFLLVLAPVIAFYVTSDLPRIRTALRRVIPATRRPQVDAFLDDASSSFAGFVRGQIVVAVFVGVGTALALSILGVPFAAVIGLVAGITDLIPFIGPFIGGALAVAVALGTDGVGTAIAAALAILAVQQLESHVISPLVVGRAVALRPLAVLVAVVAGGMAAGLVGLLIAVPLVTVARAALRQVGSVEAADPSADAPPTPA